MSIFRTALRLVARRPILPAVHLGVLGLIGVVFAGASATVGGATEIAEARPTVAVVDRDDSELSRALTSYLERRGTPVAIGSTLRDVQDATVAAQISYIAIIPEGYQDDFVAAAGADMADGGAEADAGANAGANAGAADGIVRAESDAPPKLETVVTLASAHSRYMDQLADTYLRLVRASLIAGGDGLDAALARAERLSDVTVAQTVVTKPAAQADTLLFNAYLGYAAYPLTAGILVLAGLIFHSFQTGELRRRNLVAPVSPSRMTAGIAAAVVAVCVLGWAWESVLAFTPAVGAQDVLAAAPGEFVLALAATLVYTAAPLALGFFGAQLGMGSNALNGFGTIVGLAFAFLGGLVTVGITPSGAMAAIGPFLPTYWHGRAIAAAGDAASGTAGGLWTYLGALGVEVLFAATFAALGLLAGQLRRQTADAGGLPLEED